MPTSQELLKRISKNISIIPSKTSDEAEPPAKKFRNSLETETSSSDENDFEMPSPPDSPIIPNINDTLARLSRFSGLSIIKSKNVEKSANVEDKDKYNESDNEYSGSESEHEDSASESENEESFTESGNNDTFKKFGNEKNLNEINSTENEEREHSGMTIASSKVDSDKQSINNEHMMEISSNYKDAGKTEETPKFNDDGIKNLGNKGAKDSSDEIDDLLFSDSDDESSNSKDRISTDITNSAMKINQTSEPNNDEKIEDDDDGFSDSEDDSTDAKAPRKIENVELVEFDSDNE